MAINLLSLPSTTICGISKFLDRKSLLEMREVCKSLKDHIDMLAATQETFIGIHLVKFFGTDKFSIGFLFEDEIDSLWKICIVSLFTKYRLSIVNVNISNGKEMYIKLQADIMTSFLELLKPLVKRVEFFELKIDGNCSEIIRFFSDFLEDRIFFSVDFVQEYYPDGVESRDIDMELFPLCVEFIRKVNPKDVSISFLTLIEDTLLFLLELAEIVENIYFGIKMRTSTLKNVPVSVIQSMLTKKCDRLTFSGCIYSETEVEQLLQFVNHIDTKVAFDSDTEQEAMIVQIGEYSVKISADDELTIKHLDLDIEQ